MNHIHNFYKPHQASTSTTKYNIIMFNIGLKFYSIEKREILKLDIVNQNVEHIFLHSGAPMLST